MQAIEMYTQVTSNKEIHLKLPDEVAHGKVKVIVMYDIKNRGDVTIKKRSFDQFKGSIRISDDFDDSLPDKFWIGE